MRVAVLGSAVVDYRVLVPSSWVEEGDRILFPLGQKVYGRILWRRPGGGALNVALVWKNLRPKDNVLPVASIGRDSRGDFLSDAMRKSDITTTSLCTGKRTDFSILLTPEGVKKDFVSDPVVMSISGEPGELRLPKAKWADIIYLTSMHGDPWRKALRWLEDVRPSFFMFNPNEEQLTTLDIWPRNMHVISVNRREAYLLWKRCGFSRYHVCSPHTLSYGNEVLDVEVLGKEVASRWAVRYFVVTDGGRGAHLWEREHVFYVAAPRVGPKFTAGAGDTFGATLAFYLASGATGKRALRMAVYNSARIVKRGGIVDGLCPRSLLERGVKKWTRRAG